MTEIKTVPYVPGTGEGTSLHRLLSKGQEYVDRGASYFEAHRAERDKATQHRKATELGLKLVPLA